MVAETGRSREPKELEASYGKHLLLKETKASKQQQGLLAEQPKRPVAGAGSESLCRCCLQPLGDVQTHTAGCLKGGVSPSMHSVPARVFKKALILLSEIIEK